MFAFLKAKAGDSMVGEIFITEGDDHEDGYFFVKNPLECIQDIDEEGYYRSLFLPPYPLYMGGTIKVNKSDFLYLKELDETVYKLYVDRLKDIIGRSMTFIKSTDEKEKHAEEERKQYLH